MPTVIIPDKICPHCGGTKWRVNKLNFATCSKKAQETHTAYIKRRYKTDPVFRAKAIARTLKHKALRKAAGTLKPPSAASRKAKCAYQLEYAAKFKEKILNDAKAYYQKIAKDPIKLKARKAQARIDSKRRRDQLTDGAIKMIIATNALITDKVSLKSADIPQKLIELSRKSILLKRKLRKIRKLTTKT